MSDTSANCNNHFYFYFYLFFLNKDRRGGEPTTMVITCDPKGQAGTFIGNLVIVLPEDNSKICYKITANVF